MMVTSGTGGRSGGSGKYDIHLTGAAFAVTPEPGTLGFVALGTIAGGILARAAQVDIIANAYFSSMKFPANACRYRHE